MEILFLDDRNAGIHSGVSRLSGSVLLCLFLVSCSNGGANLDEQVAEQASTDSALLDDDSGVARAVGEQTEQIGLTPDEVPRVTTTTTSIPIAEPAGSDAADGSAETSTLVDSDANEPSGEDSATTTTQVATEESTATVAEDASATTVAPATTLAPSTPTAVQTPIDDCDAVPENCVEPGEDFSNQDLNSSVFFRSEVSGVNFSNLNLADTDFSESRAIGTNFTGATMTDAIIEGADFTGADFTDANLLDAFVAQTTLTRAVWSNTTCPDGTNSDANGGTCEGTF